MLLITAELNQFLWAIIILAGAGIISAILRFILTRFFNHESALINVNPTQYVILKNLITLGVFILAVGVMFQFIPTMNKIGGWMAASAGIVAAIVGFAAQKAFSNIISGFFLMYYKPFRVGDVVEIDNVRGGIVEDITLQHTIVKDFENRRIILPNTKVIDGIIINSTTRDKKINKRMDFLVKFDTDIDKAMQIIHEEVEAHPCNIDNRSALDIENEVPRVSIRVVNLGTLGITIRAYAWAENNARAYEMATDVMKTIYERFRMENIELASSIIETT